MYNLEEELRKSRQMDRPDLQPPPGGWEQIADQLPAAPLPWYAAWKAWLFAWAIFIALAAGAWFAASPLSPQAPPLAERPEIYATETPAVEIDQPRIEFSAPQGADSPRGVMMKKPGLIRIPALLAASSEAQSDQASFRAKEGMPKEVNGADAGAVNGGKGPGSNLPFSQGTHPTNSSNPTAAINPLPAQLPATIPGSSLLQYLPTRRDQTPAAPILLFSQGTNSINVPAITGTIGGKKHTYAPRWQLHGGVSTWFPSAWDGEVNFYRRSAQNLHTRFVLPSGEIINGEYERYETLKERDWKMYQIKLGGGRQTRWGGYVKMDLNYLHEKFQASGDILAGLETDQIVKIKNFEERVLYVSTGLEYTFLKRHRFRPYVGLSALGFISYNGKEQSVFYDERSQSSGLVDGLAIETYFSSRLDWAVSSGFQYALNPRWSVGLSVFLSRGRDILIELPLGIETRYTLGQ